MTINYNKNIRGVYIVATNTGPLMVRQSLTQTEQLLQKCRKTQNASVWDVILETGMQSLTNMTVSFPPDFHIKII